MKFATQYKYEKIAGKHFQKPTMCDRSFAYDADINNIVNGMALVPQAPAQPPQFGLEFNPEFYQNALNTVATAKSEFEKLPALVRKEFDNDPMKLLQFIDNPSEENAKKGVKLGIFNKDILEQFKTVLDTSKPTVQPSATDNQQSSD